MHLNISNLGAKLPLKHAVASGAYTHVNVYEYNGGRDVVLSNVDTGWISGLSKEEVTRRVDALSRLPLVYDDLAAYANSVLRRDFNKDFDFLKQQSDGIEVPVGGEWDLMVRWLFPGYRGRVQVRYSGTSGTGHIEFSSATLDEYVHLVLIDRIPNSRLLSYHVLFDVRALRGRASASVQPNNSSSHDTALTPLGLEQVGQPSLVGLEHLQLRLLLPNLHMDLNRVLSDEVVTVAPAAGFISLPAGTYTILEAGKPNVVLTLGSSTESRPLTADRKSVV